MARFIVINSKLSWEMSSKHKQLLILIVCIVGLCAYLKFRDSHKTPQSSYCLENFRNIKRSREAHVSRSAEFDRRLATLENISVAEKRIAYKAIYISEMRLNPDLVAFELMRNEYLRYSDKIEVASALAYIWEDVDLLMSWVEDNIAGKYRLELLGIVLKRQVVENPGAAISYLDSFPDGSSGKLELSRTVLSSWAISDYKSVLEYATNLEDPELRKWGRQRALESFVNTDRSAALELLNNSDQDVDLEFLASYLGVSRMDTEEPRVVMDWAFSLRGRIGDQARRSMLVKWASIGGVRDAADYLDQRIHSDHAAELASVLARAWSVSDPEKAAEWAQGYSSRNNCAKVIKEVVRGWSSIDPMEAYKWLDGLPPGPPRDEGIMMLIQNEVRVDPATTFLWVDSISNSKLRDNAFELVKSVFEKNIKE